MGKNPFNKHFNASNVESGRDKGPFKANKKNKPQKSKNIGSQLQKASLQARHQAKNAGRSENPFDKFNNSKKKHEVVNRRVKGDERDVGRAKQKAVEDRKNRLLDQYKKVKKSNVFLDKRFGETDAELSLEDKMFLRFQKEKVRTIRNSSIYNLDSNEEEALTHKGEILGTSNINDGSFSDDDDDEDDKLGKEIVNRLHFGGGLVPKTSSESNASTGQKSNHLDALQDIITKSKQQKQLKKAAKDEQETERERLDSAFRELLSEAAVSFRPIRGQGRDADDLDDDQTTIEVDEYDKSLAVMAYESKVQATDRTKTAEEIALEEKNKLEELEKERQARMRKNRALDEANELDQPGYSYGNQRSKKRQRTDDEIDFEGDFDKKNRSQQNMRDEDDENDGEDDLSDGEDEEKEEDYEIDDYDEENPSNNKDDDDEEDGEEEEKEEDSDMEEKDDDDEDEDDEASDNDDDDDDDDDDGAIDSSEALKEKQTLKQKSLSKSSNDLITKSEMPHEIACPGDIAEFYDMIEQFTNNLSDIQVLIDRILVWNSVLLPGAEGKNNRVPMHNFLDILLKYFIRVGDALPVSSSSSNNSSNEANNTSIEVMDHLDYLTKKIFKLCQEINEVAPSLFGRWLKQFEKQLQKRLRDYSMGYATQSGSCYPSVGRLLFFKLISHVFSVTEYRHAIVSASMLFLCQTLAQCPVQTIEDIASGLLIASILIDYVSDMRCMPSQPSSIENAADNEYVEVKYVPEIFSYVISLLSFYLDENSLKKASFNKNVSKTFNAASLRCLRDALNDPKTPLQSSDSSMDRFISWEWFHAQKNNLVINNNISSTILCVIYSIIHQLMDIYIYSPLNPAICEVFDDIVDILVTMQSSSNLSIFPSSLQDIHRHLLNSLTEKSLQCGRQRHPLQYRKPVKTSIDTKLPRFDVNYKLKKDMTSDQEMNLLKQLRRQLKREKKGTIRELRRDNEFLDQIRYTEKQEQRKAIQEERWKNYAWMEEQQAVMNMHVKRFKGELKGGGSNGVKPVKQREKRGKNK